MSEPFEAEIKKYTEALAADPKSRVFVPLSDTYRKLGRYDEAIAVAREGLAVHPNYMGGKMALARACFEYGELDPAQGLLEEILVFASDNLIANRLLAQIYLQKGMKGKAAPLLRQLVALDPSDAWAKGQLEPAPVAKAAPPPPTQTATLAQLYRSQGHPEPALEIYRKLAASAPDDPSLRSAVTELETEISGRGKPEEEAPSGRRAFLEALLVRIGERRRAA